MKTLTLKNISKALIITGALCAVSLPATAKNHHKYGNRAHATYDYAKVVNVDPVYETYQVNHPVEKCYDKRVPVRQQPKHRNSSYTNEIIGGVIGGAIGNRVGKRGGGSARDVATVIGAVLGASVANDIERKKTRKKYQHNDYADSGYKVVQHCELHDSYHSKRELVGYNVAYRYHGNVYYTKLDRHPGKKIKVKVVVNPV